MLSTDDLRQGLDLTLLEAKALARLLSAREAMSVRELATGAQIPLQKAYEVLSRLEHKGYVRCITSDPKRYDLASFRVVNPALAEQVRLKATELDRAYRIASEVQGVLGLREKIEEGATLLLDPDRCKAQLSTEVDETTATLRILDREFRYVSYCASAIRRGVEARVLA